MDSVLALPNRETTVTRGAVSITNSMVAVVAMAAAPHVAIMQHIHKVLSLVQHLLDVRQIVIQ